MNEPVLNLVKDVASVDFGHVATVDLGWEEMTPSITSRTQLELR